MLRLASVLTLVFLTGLLKAQSPADRWEVYIARFQSGLGSVTVDMDLQPKAPFKQHPYLLEVVVKSKDCDKRGFPSADELLKFQALNDSTESFIATTKLGFIAGTYTAHCYRHQYFYVNDSAKAQSGVEQLLNKQFSLLHPIVDTRIDSTSKTYLHFLYPDQVMQDFIEDQKVVQQLQLNGDSLTTPRQVDHLIYFLTKDDREKFSNYAKSEDYKIVSTDYNKKWNLPYELRIAKVQAVDIESISKATKPLREMARKLKGSYDGWLTVIVNSNIMQR